MLKLLAAWRNSDFLWKYEFCVCVFAVVSVSSLIIFLFSVGD